MKTIIINLITLTASLILNGCVSFYSIKISSSDNNKVAPIYEQCLIELNYNHHTNPSRQWEVDNWEGEIRENKELMDIWHRDHIYVWIEDINKNGISLGIAQGHSKTGKPAADELYKCLAKYSEFIKIEFTLEQQ